MLSTQELFDRVGVRVPNVLLPRSNVDLYRWAVIACDQHTSEPDYWREVSRIVGDAPSTLHLIYPEVHLGAPDSGERIAAIHRTMRSYLDESVLTAIGEAMVLTRRETPYVSDRRGLVLALDLEQYDYTPGAQSLTRATEQTIVERIPPRVRIREGAPVELPHVLVLIDDRDDELFGGLTDRNLERLYETDLMLGGGRVGGYRVDGEALDHVAKSLVGLADRSAAASPFLFAVGDGNHSLATAKAVWEKMRADVGPDHPARYALVEIVNLYDPGLRFEPIHRLVRTADPAAWVRSLADALGSRPSRVPRDELRAELGRDPTAVGYVVGDEQGVIRLPESIGLPVAAVQAHINDERELDVDYIHGWETTVRLGGEERSVAIILPEFDPARLYPTVAARGVLPRKAFSLGEAEEKRYYLEARRIC